MTNTNYVLVAIQVQGGSDEPPVFKVRVPSDTRPSDFYRELLNGTELEPPNFQADPDVFVRAIARALGVPITINHSM